MLYRNLLLLSFLLFSAYSLSKESTVTFELEVDPAKPEIGSFSADTSALEEITLLPPRTLTGLTDKLLAIQCTQKGSKRTVSYNNQIRCDRFEWKIPFKSVDNLDRDVSEQISIFSQVGWWALFEWDMIPRIEEVSDILVCAHIDSEHNERNCQKLPTLNQPPMIMVWGKPSAELHESRAIFRIFTDSEGSTLTNKKNRQRVFKQYQYLKELFPSKESKTKSVDLAWVGIQESKGIVGGAAGAKSFVANYAVRSRQVTDDSKERLFWISGHEMFHMITPQRYPLWVSESLAHYYGYKSLAQYDVPSFNPLDEWKEKRSQIAIGDTGLYTANIEVTKNRNMQFYGLFYEKGAAFWYELDSLLQRKNHSLDQYLPLLGKSNVPSERLSDEFIETISRIAGKQKIQQLLSEYL